MEMNLKTSLFVIFFSIFYKILGFQSFLLIFLSLVIFLLCVVICILIKTPKKTFQELIYTNPLSDSKRTLELKFSSNSEPLTLRKNDSLNAKFLRPLSGNADNDEVLHRILDYVFRDFIDSWYNIISENKEFSTHVRLLTEDCLSNFIKRVKQSPLMSVITTTMLDDVAAHSKAYQDAMKMMKESQKGPKNLGKFNSSFHRRNKSESDVMWNAANAQKKVANSTFYYIQNNENLMDPKKQLIETFFDITGDFYKKEVHDDKALEKHLIEVMETCMYYTFDPNSFQSDALRTLVSSIIGSLIGKLISNNISDPDFINFQISKIFANNPPSSEWLIKTIRQSNDLSELLAVRHLITREMDQKYKEKNCVGEISSLSFTQKIIDLRITSLQTNKDSRNVMEQSTSKLPRLTLDEILSKDIALSYYLDYLQVMNLQKYVIFYCLAQDWKEIATEKINKCPNDEFQKLKISKDLRDRAFELFKEFLVKTSTNVLQVDQGLIEVLHIKIKDTFISPDPSWFDSILKFLFEKLKNEHVFLQNFYESPAYKKLIAELEDNEIDVQDVKFTSSQAESGSDSNSGDYLLDELDLLEDEGTSLGVNAYRHQRSHSDTGVLLDRQKAQGSNESNEKKLTAKIINTAINSDGKFAVYAINVVTNETDKDGNKQQKSWHVYRRYKKFLELKNILVRQFQYFKNISLPFPKKQTFHNTSRDLLERRMVILNEFLNIICNRAETDTLVLAIVLEFLEPDNDDRQIHGTKVVKHLVNPIKTGMKSIKSVPLKNNVIGGLSKIFVSKSTDKFEISDEVDTSNAYYPTLASFINFLNAIFDLDSRSQWLKRGIERIISARFVSQSINKKIKDIVQKNILDPSVIHGVLCGILNNTWPNGVFQESIPREDVTKLRTRMAAKVAIFAFLTDDLKHILGSETTRLGLTNFYEMLQYKTLNKRLILILLDRFLTAVLPTDNLKKHVRNK